VIREEEEEEEELALAAPLQPTQLSAEKEPGAKDKCMGV